MQGKDLIEILNVLQKEKKLKLLKKFLHADYFNQSKDVKYLFAFLLKWMDSKKKEKAWAALAIAFIRKQKPRSRAVFGKNNLENLMSRLLHLMTDFIAMDSFGRTAVPKNMVVTKYALNYNMPRLFRKQFKKTAIALAKYPTFSIERSTLAHELEHLNYQFFHHEQRTTKNNLQTLSNQIDTNFMINRLKCSCNLLSHQLVAKEVYQDFWIHPVLQYLEENNRYENIEGLVKIYYYCYKLLSQQNTAKNYAILDMLKLYLRKQEAVICKLELKNVYMIIINFLINQLNYQKDTTTYPFYRDEIIEWVNNILQIYQPSEYFDFQHTIYNAVAVILKVKIRTEKAYQRVYTFINDKVFYIPLANQKAFKSYNLGFMHFKRGAFLIDQQIEFSTKGKTGQTLQLRTAYALKVGYQQAKSAYDQATKELVKYHFFQDTPRRLMARTALLRIYYDLPEKMDFEKAMVEMNQYLATKEVKQLSEGKYRMFRNFCSILDELHQFKNVPTKSANIHDKAMMTKTYSRLKNQIFENPALWTYRDWLLHRLHAIWVAE